jgi:hypothetical protein
MRIAIDLDTGFDALLRYYYFLLQFPMQSRMNGDSIR